MIITKKNQDNDFLKKNNLLEQFNGILKKKNLASQYNDLFFDKKVSNNFIKNLSSQQLKENTIKNIHEKEVIKDLDKELLYKSNNSTINELLNNINGDDSKKNYKKDNNLINQSNKKKRNFINLIDKNGEYCLEFLENDSSLNKFKNEVNLNNDNSNEESTSRNLGKMRKEIEEKLNKNEEEKNKKNKDMLKFTINNFPNINNLNEIKEGFLFTLREKDDIDSNLNRNNEELNEIKHNDIFNNPINLNKKKENEPIIYDKNIIDFFSGRSLKSYRRKNSIQNYCVSDKVINQKIKEYNEYFNKIEKKFSKSKSSLDILDKNKNNKNIYFNKISNSNRNYQYFQSKINLNFMRSKIKNTKIKEEKSNSIYLNPSSSYITDNYCDKMVKMKILSIKTSNSIKKINERNISFKNKFYLKK